MFPRQPMRKQTGSLSTKLAATSCCSEFGGQASSLVEEIIVDSAMLEIMFGNCVFRTP